jgi:methylated-DNA-protein-cysteine methyltransferase related protein
MGSRPHPVVTDRERQIVAVLMTLRPGEVTTYGDVAEVAGHPRQARLVGRILATTEVDVPWWRVVNAAGKLVAHETRLQAELLAAEGVTVAGGRVVHAPTGRFSRTVQPVGSADGSVDGPC